MKMLNSQRGLIPLIVIIALIAAMLGGYIGFQLGDGTFFSFGIGFGIVFLGWLYLREPVAARISRLREKKRV